MPAERVSMRRVREILRLKHGGASDRQIARSLSLARSTVALTLERAAAAELGWPLPATLTDRVLEARCTPAMAAGKASGAKRARLGPHPSRAAPARRDADAAVGRIPAARAGRLRLQPLVRAVPRLGRPAVAEGQSGISCGGWA